MAFSTFLLVTGLLGAALAGPISWDETECAKECSSGTSKFSYEPGKIYVYSYQSQTLMGLTNDDSDNVKTETQAEIRARAEIHVKSKCEMVLQLRDVSLSGTGQDLSFKTALEANPLPFAFDDGNIKELCPHPDDEVRPFVLNNKRAILSALKNTMDNLEVKQEVREVDIAGECLTKYSSVKGWSSVTVSKSKDLTSCKQRQNSAISRFGKPYFAEYSPIQSAPLLLGKLECQQVVKNGLIENAECQERNVFSPISRSGKGAAIETTIKMVLKNTRDGALSEKVLINKRTNLLFSIKPLTSTAFGQESEAREVLEKICAASREGVRPTVPHLIARLIAVLRTQPYENIARIYEGLDNNQICPSDISQDIYVDALSMAGTEGAVKFMVKLVKEDKISALRKQAWLTFLAFNTHVDEAVIRAALPLLRDYSLGGRQALLGISSMIYNFCSNDTSDDNESACEDLPVIKEVISILQKQLGSKCKANDREETQRIRETLAAFENIGYLGDAQSLLTECFLASSNSHEIRHAALLAFKRTHCDENVTKKMTQLFQNDKEESDIRIYAYRATMRCANKEIVRLVAQTLDKEQVQQVGAFVLSHLRNMKETSAPLKQDIRKIVTDVKLNEKFPSDVRKFSQYFEVSTFSERLNVGGEAEFQIVRSPKNLLPRSAFLNLTVNALGNELNILELGAEMDGMTYLMEKYFGHDGYFSKLSVDELLAKFGLNRKDRDSDNSTEDEEEEENRKRVAREAKNPDISRMALLHERMNVNTPSDAKMSAYFSLLGRKIGILYASDIKSLFDLKEAFSIMELLTELSKNQKVERSVTLQLLDTELTIPSFSGMEISLAVNATAVVAVQAEGKFDIRKLLTSERSADIDGHFSPSAAVEVSAIMALDSGVHRSSLKVVANAHTSQYIEGKVQIKDGRIFSLKVNMPKEKIEFLTLKSDVYTVDTDGQERPLTPPGFHNIDTCSKIFNRPLGVEFCAQAKTPKPLYNKNAPLIPVAGPMHLEIYLKKTDKTLRSYNFNLELPGEHDYNEMTYKLELDTPGSQINRHYAAEVRFNKQSEEQTLNFALTSPIKKLAGTASLVGRRELSKARLYVTVDEKKSYELQGELKSSIASGRTQLEPSIKVVWPGIEPITMKGSLTYTAGRKEQLAIDLQANRPLNNPSYLRGTIAKEGDFSTRNLDGRLKVSTDLTLFTPFLEARLHGTADKQDTVYSTDLSLNYKVPSKNQHTAKVVTKVQNLSTRHLTKISTKTEATFTQYPESNTLVSWEYQHKPKEHFENDFKIMLGKNYQSEDTPFLHILQVSKLQGLENRGRKGETENRLFMSLPVMEHDVDLNVKTQWDIVDKPSFSFDCDLKYLEDKHIQAALNYKFISVKPMEMEFEAKLSTPKREYIYQDKVKERSPNEYEGKTMLQWARGKRINVEYIYKIKTDSSKMHHEVDVNLKSPFSKIPIQQKALLSVTRDAIDVRSHTKYEGRPLYSIDAKLSRTGRSVVDVKAYGIEGLLEVQNDRKSKSAKIDIKSQDNDYHYVASTDFTLERNKKSVEIQATWNIEKDPSNQLKLAASVNRASPRYVVDIHGNYRNDAHLKIIGDLEENIIKGTHNINLDFNAPHMNPVTVTFHHEMEDDVAKCLLRYLNNHVEQLEVRTHGKFLIGKSVNVDAGIELKSLNPELDGKLISVSLKHEFKSSNYVANIRVQTSPSKPYNLNLDLLSDLQHSRNKVKAHATLSTPYPTYRHQEAIFNVETSRNNYLFSSELTNAQNKQIKSVLQLQGSGSVKSGNLKLETPFTSVKSVQLNVELEEADAISVQSFLDVNSERKLAFISRVQYESRNSIDASATLKTNIGPKYEFGSHLVRDSSKRSLEMSMKREDLEVMSSKFLLEKQGKVYNGQMQLRNNDWTWIVNAKDDRKNSDEIIYTFTSRGIGKPISVTLNVKRNGNEIAPTLSVCPSFRGTDCLIVEGRYKNEDGSYTLHRELAFKLRDQPGQELTFDYLLSVQKNSYVHRAELDVWGKELGFENKIEIETNDKSKAQMKIKLPSRELLARMDWQVVDEVLKIHSEYLADSLRQPSQKLTIDTNLKESRQRGITNLQADLSINHPNLDSPISISISADLNTGRVKRPINLKAEVDFSSDPSQKMFGEFYVEESSDNKSNITLFFSIHQADRNALEIQVDGHIGADDDRLTSGAHYKLINSGKTYEMTKYAEFNHRDNALHYYLQTPKNHYQAHAGWKYTPNQVFQLDTDYKTNDDEGSAKLVVDSPKPCVELTFFNNPGVPSSRYHLCIDAKNKQMLSLTADAYVGNERLTDVNVVFDRRDDRTFSAKFHWRPEKVGEILHQLMEWSDKLESDTSFDRALKKFSDAVSSLAAALQDSILSPMADHISREVTTIVRELSADFRYVRKTAARIYQQLPVIEDALAPYTKVVADAIEDLQHYFAELFPESLIESIEDALKSLEKKIEKVCGYGTVCYNIKYAYNNKGWEGIGEYLYGLIENMPDAYYKILVATKDLVLENIYMPSVDWEPLKKAFEYLGDWASEIIQPAFDSEIAALARKTVEEWKHKIQEQYEQLMEAVKAEIEERIQKIMSLPQLKAFVEILEQIQREIEKELKKINVPRTWEKLQELSEEFFNVNALSNSVRTVILDPENGKIEVEVHLPKSPEEVKVWLKESNPFAVVAEDEDSDENYDVETFTVADKMSKIQAGLKQEWLPPFKGHAQLIGGQHYVTFDSSFYDFAGECSYLLARDFADGNFSVVVKYEGQDNKGTGRIDKSIIVVAGDKIIEVDPDEATVQVGDQEVELPYSHGPVTVVRRGSTIVVDYKRGLSVTCHLVHDYCTTAISGWYQGKTAGLFGTYDHEPANDYTRPRGQVDTSASTFARSWEVSSGCRFRNLAQEVDVDPQDEKYEICRRAFKDSSSPLRPCFQQVNQQEYMKMCMRQVAIQKSPSEAMCTVAAAFAHICRQKSLPVTLPSQCLTCKSKNDFDIDFGSRHRIQYNQVQSADVVFIVEEQQCNRHIVKDIDSISRLVERELVDSGYSDNRYAIVAFGGPKTEQQAHSHTARGKIFFNQKDMVLATERMLFKPSSKNSHTDTFGAIKAAVRYPFRAGASKSFILMTCTPCDEDDMSMSYSDIQNLLLQRGIVLHTLSEKNIKIRKSSSKGKAIYGLDAQTIYHMKDVSQKKLEGTPELRSQVSIPKDKCIALAQEVGGSFFSTIPVTQGSSNEAKNWKSLLARRIASTAQPHQCQDCDCDSADDVPLTICKPCSIPTPTRPIAAHLSNEDDDY